MWNLVNKRLKEIKNEETLFALLILIKVTSVENILQIILIILTVLIWWDRTFITEKNKSLLILMTAIFFMSLFMKEQLMTVEWLIFSLILFFCFYHKRKLIKTIYLLPLIVFSNYEPLILSTVIASIILIQISKKNEHSTN
jgi:hypothetical protein